MTAFGLAEFYRGLNSRDFEGPRIDRGHCGTNSLRGPFQLEDLTGTASGIIPVSPTRPRLVKYSRVAYSSPGTW
jgi:hypothetical protein